MEFRQLGRTEDDREELRRHCTDVCCCAIFTVFLGVFIGVAAYGLRNGDPDLLIYPFDIAGNQCGRPSRSTASYKFLYFLTPAAPEYTICVQDCASPCSTAHPNAWISACVPHLGFAYRDKSTNATEYALEYRASSFLDRFCLPDQSTMREMYEIVSGQVHDGDAYEWAQDIAYSWTAILLVVAVSFGVSLVYLALLRVATWLVLAASVLGVAGGLVAFGLYVQSRADSDYSDTAQSTAHRVMTYFSYTCYGVAGLFIVIVFFMWRRIQLAVAIVKCALDFMGEVCSILLVPLLNFILVCGLIALWVFSLAYLYSCGEIEHKDQYSAFGNITWDEKTRDLFYFFAVGIIWIIEVQLLFTQLVLALAVCLWYFDHDSTRRHSSKLCTAIYTAARYHVGSVALAAAVLTAAKLVKWALYYIQKRVYQSDFAGNQLVKYFCVCIGCCVDCFERFIQYVDKNALIAMAYSSRSSFCQCAQTVFDLLATNAARFIAIGSIGELLSLLGKAAIMTLSTAFGFLLLTKCEHYSDRIESPVPACVVFLLVSYSVSSLFLSVFEMTSDCLIVFYIEDERRNKTKSLMHAPSELHQFMETHRDADDSMCCCWK